MLVLFFFLKNLNKQRARLEIAVHSSRLLLSYFFKQHNLIFEE